MSDSWTDDSGIDGNYDNTSDSSESGDVDETNERTNTNEIRNIRDAWNGRTCYVPDDLATEIDRAFLSMQNELLDGERNVKKNRHFYPVVLKLGVEALEDADVDQLESLIDGIHG